MYYYGMPPTEGVRCLYCCGYCLVMIGHWLVMWIHRGCFLTWSLVCTKGCCMSDESEVPEIRMLHYDCTTDFGFFIFWQQQQHRHCNPVCNHWSRRNIFKSTSQRDHFARRFWPLAVVKKLYCIFCKLFPSLLCYVISRSSVIVVLYLAGCIPTTFLNADIPLRAASAHQPRKLFITWILSSTYVLYWLTVVGRAT